MVVAAACGFPNPAIEGDEGGTTPGVDASDADAGATDGQVNDGPVFDGGLDVTIVTDAGSKIDPSGCDATSSCDCDKDGFHHLTVDGGVTCDASVVQGNVDCNDYDTRYRPNQEFVQTPGDTPGSEDWNCNGTIERALTVNVTCAGITNLFTCQNLQGFRGAPDCGISDPYVFCTKGGLAGLDCVEGNVQSRPQACK